MAFCPCSRKSRRSAQMTSSLSLLREPRSRPAGFPPRGATHKKLGDKGKMAVLAFSQARLRCDGPCQSRSRATSPPQDAHALRKLLSHLPFGRAIYLRPAEPITSPLGNLLFNKGV